MSQIASAQRNCDWIIACISHVYKVPGMYGGSQAELDGQLWILHSVWAYIVDRDGDFRRENLALRNPTSPPGFFDVVANNSMRRGQFPALAATLVTPATGQPCLFDSIGSRDERAALMLDRLR